MQSSKKTFIVVFKGAVRRQINARKLRQNPVAAPNIKTAGKKTGVLYE
nr:MAG TPA: hypothetical protein [Caudoviricetes sp.]